MAHKIRNTNAKSKTFKRIYVALLTILALFAVYGAIYTWTYHCDSASEKLKGLDLSYKESNYLIESKKYEGSMSNIVLPYVDSLQTNGSFKNGSHTIAYNMYLLDDAKANIVISHGFIERKEKYKEAIYYFLKMGYQVFILDHSGHGSSSRECPDSSMIHVEAYENFASDLNAFITGTVQKHSKDLKTILFGHSMGGAIAALTVENNPELVDGLILNAPMLKIKNPIPEFVGEPVTKLMIALGKGKEYAIGHRKFNPKTDLEYNPTLVATYCKERAQYWHNTLVKLSQHPTTGASWGAGANFIDLTHEVLSKGNVEKIKIPILMFQAEHDAFVEPQGQYEFANRAKNIAFYFVKDAGHEIYIEEDYIIGPYFSKVEEFVERVVE